MAKKAAPVSKWVWKKVGTLIYGSCDFKPSTLILGFDMDDTLIKTKSGAKFAKDAKDWQWWHPDVAKGVQEFSKKDYQIVIFTNQNGISQGHAQEGDIKAKIEEIQAQINVPMAAYIASADDDYRKPRQEMWNHFAANVNEGKHVDVQKSIYCGDAAGRVDGKKKDFSDSDLKFAINIGLQFKTPEQFFLKQDLDKDYLKLIGFDPRNLPRAEKEKLEFPKPAKPESKQTLTVVIIMIGAPGSGKSTFVQNHLKDYVRVNRDSLKTKEKCLKAAEAAMKEKKYVVIDNTNPTAADREPYIKLAKDNGYNVRAFFINVEKDLAFHNDTQREVNKFRKHSSKRVGRIPIHSFFKYHELANTKEGFSEVKTVNFAAGPFENADDEKIYFSFVKGK